MCTTALNFAWGTAHFHGHFALIHLIVDVKKSLRHLHTLCTWGPWFSAVVPPAGLLLGPNFMPLTMDCKELCWTLSAAYVCHLFTISFQICHTLFTSSTELSCKSCPALVTEILLHYFYSLIVSDLADHEENRSNHFIAPYLSTKTCRISISDKIQWYFTLQRPTG